MSGHRTPRRRFLRCTAVTSLGIALSMVATTESSVATAAPVRRREAGNPLPDWFGGNRVWGQNIANINPYRIGQGNPAYDRNAEAYAAMGGHAFVRHIKVRDEDPWWPSAAPLGPNGERLFDADRWNIVPAPDHPKVFLPAGTNLVKEMAGEAHAHGMHMAGYYRDYNNDRVARMHPEWVAKHLDGSDWVTGTGLWLDITEPGYQDMIKTHLIELADSGVDAFYFDYTHLPYSEGARRTHLEQTFTEKHGGPPPDSDNEDDPGVRAWRSHCALEMTAHYHFLKEQVQVSYPGVGFIVSVTYLPGLTDAHMRTGLGRVTDSAKTEWDSAVQRGLRKSVFYQQPDRSEPDDNVSRSLGWTMLRDLAQGGPPHVWVSGTASDEQAVACAAAILAHGAIASFMTWDSVLDEALGLDVEEVPWGGFSRAGLEQCFALNEKVRSVLSGTRSVRFAAVHHAEAQRDARGRSAFDAWREVLWHTVGYYGVLSAAGVPTSIVTDDDLATGSLSGYRLLMLPHRDELSTAQAQHVDAFEADGGIVVTSDPGWNWIDPAQTESVAQAVHRAVAEQVKHSPVEVQQLGNGSFASSFLQPAQSPDRSPRLVVTLTNDFSHVQKTTRGDTQSPPTQPPPPASGVTVRWQREIALSDLEPGWAWRLAGIPSGATEVVTGQSLSVRATMDGYTVDVPEFQHLAVVVVEYPTPS